MIDLKLSNWKSILQDIYCPVIGSIWVAQMEFGIIISPITKTRMIFIPLLLAEYMMRIKNVGLYQVHLKSIIRARMCSRSRLTQKIQTALTLTS